MTSYPSDGTPSCRRNTVPRLFGSVGFFFLICFLPIFLTNRRIQLILVFGIGTVFFFQYTAQSRVFLSRTNSGDTIIIDIRIKKKRRGFVVVFFFFGSSLPVNSNRIGDKEIYPRAAVG